MVWISLKVMGDGFEAGAVYRPEKSGASAP